MHHKETIGHSSYSDLDLTFQGHPRSKVMVPNERSYMTSYMLSMITLCLGCMVCEIEAFQWFYIFYFILGGPGGPLRAIPGGPALHG